MIRRLRLLEVLFSFDSGGSERIGAVLARGLTARGWVVDVAATHSSTGPIRASLEAFGVPCHGLDVEQRWGWFARRWAVFRLCRRLRPDVLHAQHVSMFVLCFWPAWLAGVRHFVVSEHNEILLRDRPALQRALRRLAGRLTRIIVIHEGLASYLVSELGLDRSRIRVIANGVDSDRFAPALPDLLLRAELGASDGTVLVGCVARLHPYKDHDTLIQAFARCVELLGSVQVKLVLIGEGELRADIENRICALGLQKRVVLLGDRLDTDRLIPQLDLLVLASRTEGVPMVLLEAMAGGVPCIATAVGGVPELLEGGGGEVVQAGDIAGLADAMARYCTDDRLRRRAGLAARARLLSGYREVDMVNAYEHELAESTLSEPLANST